MIENMLHHPALPDNRSGGSRVLHHCPYQEEREEGKEEMSRKERERTRKKIEDAKRERVLEAIRAVYDRNHASSSGFA